MVAKTRTRDSAALKKLTFNEKIVGKGLSTDALLKKLKQLHTELAELDQEGVDLASLNNARSQLINTSVTLHKDRGVKAYAACCLADILRLYAPDAPYTHNELRDIFQFFFRQLSTGLKGSDATYYNEYFHLLESLSTVKSVVLVCDLPHAEELMVEIFRDFFGLIRRDLAKKIEMFIADILIALIDECQALPSEVLDTLLAQFLDEEARIDKGAYRLAVQVCNATADKLQRHVCQYFTDIIVAHSREEDLDEIRKAHDLVKQLSRACPALLHSVIPQLEEELRVEDVQVRLMATQALGDMFADKGGADLIRKYPTAWAVWQMRRNDKAPAVRLKLVESAKGLIVNLRDSREVVEDMLRSKLLDPDEKVRAAVCKVYAQLDYETALHHVSEDQLRSVANRGLDKKQSVRSEAMNAIGKLYSLAYPEIEAGEPVATKHFGWIPNEIVQIASISVESKATAEQVLADYILPFPSAKASEIDEAAWTDRLLNIMQALDDEKSVNTLLNISGIRANRPTVYEHFVQACIDHNGGVIDENEDQIKQKLDQTARYLSRTYPDAQKANDDLHAFADANEARLYKLLKTCTDTQSDLKSLVKASSEFLRRTEQSAPSALGTMSIFLRRATLRLVNTSSVPTLLKRVASHQQNTNAHAHARTVLTYVSKHCPALFKPHVSELAKALAEKGERNAGLVEVGLMALAAVVRWDGSLAVGDRRTLERIKQAVLGPNARHAKFAARYLAYCKDREEMAIEVIEKIADELEDVDDEHLVAHLAVLAQFARLSQEVFAHRSEVVTTFLLKKVLMVECPPDEDDMDTDVDWVEDADVPATLRARILALKILRNRSLACAAREDALDIAAPTLKMLVTLLENQGAYTPDSADDDKFKTRIRLQAAVSLLHLSTIQAYQAVIHASFVWLAITVQDPCYNVRAIFLTKLVLLLTPRKLPARFNIIPFLTVHDPEADVKTRATAYVQFAVRSLPPSAKVESLELIFIRLLHLLAHHPDFSLEHENLQEMAKYIEYYLGLIATSENISLLYHLALKGKTVRDSESYAFSENLYATSELAQELIKVHAQTHSWSLDSYPGKVKLPSDILRALPNAEAATKILKTVYLPEDTMSWLREAARAQKAAIAKDKRKEARDAKTSPPKRRGRPKANGNAKRQKRNKAARWNSDQSESEEEVSEDESGEEQEEEEAPNHQRVDPDTEKAPDTSDAPSEEEASEKEDNEETEGRRKLGRNARNRANEKIRKQVGKGRGKKR
ncbi:cohesin-associated protein Pds5 [Coniophora puteana RWD-64-598 SS2]|uniref:Cohesin-associated protein Pds5 n=1 Tax=Coniophora puteana (strain RWD-64-598) TaxID=741705 RepID=A0A5M3MCX3_CONPW|nr:cohesin-associated protein Pds5 [Coniophora puteana RWD-64-598 SS2]EIW77089.1 cohesin-associated protein Pds5 [Coniophora puteana RWD-64-598 SS2]